MNIIFKDSPQDILNTIRKYTTHLTGICDDFWEDKLLYSKLYDIVCGDATIGYFAILDDEKMTMFHVEIPYMRMAQQIFKSAIEKYNIKTAFVTTCDETFLSLCLDLHTKIELQACFFDWMTCDSITPPKYGFECIQEVSLNDVDEINKITDNFFKGTESIPSTKIYKLTHDNVILGFGLLFQNPVVSEYYACGMVTLEQYRNQGVGRSMQIHLANICYTMGVKPISGCWYYNHNSKKTIESAGRFSKTRLLNVHF